MRTYNIYEFRGNGLVYFGATINPELRRKKHVNATCKNQSSMFHFFNKYGVSSFVFSVLFTFDNPEDMKNKEIELISKEPVDNLINKRKGGEWYGKCELPPMKKAITFTGDSGKAIQEYANLHCEGNFSLAVRKLIELGIKQEQQK